MAYPNGEVPLNKLIHVQNNIWLPAGTLARWNWAVQQGKAKYGITLRITGQNSFAWNTWNGYRPLSAQILYKIKYGNLAATPRTSSHGGFFRNKEVFAIDVDNWAQMGWARFAALMRLAGLTVDFVSPREQWHVGDFNNPWIIPAFASGGGGSHVNPKPTPKPPVPKPLPEPTLEELMAFKSVTIAHRLNEGVDKFDSTSLDWADGATLEVNNTHESYQKSFADGFTEGGLKILTKGNYDYVLQEFTKHQETMRERELAIARASAGK